jgi:hypothetical protein
LDAQKWLIDNGLTQNKRANTIISKCCSGDIKTGFDYIWKYLPEPI